LPSEAAGGIDKEKANYIPGIWDDAYLSFTGKLRIWRVLLLPKVSEKKATVKLLVRSFYPPQTTYGGLKGYMQVWPNSRKRSDTGTAST
jgi:hypothetical protein